MSIKTKNTDQLKVLSESGQNLLEDLNKMINEDHLISPDFPDYLSEFTEKADESDKEERLLK